MEIWDAYDKDFRRVPGVTLTRGEKIPAGLYHLFKDCTPAPDFALTLPGEGDIPLAAIYRRLREDGYDGCVSLEWERRWHPDFPPVGTALDAMLALLRD